MIIGSEFFTFYSQDLAIGKNRHLKISVYKKNGPLNFLMKVWFLCVLAALKDPVGTVKTFETAKVPLKYPNRCIVFSA